MAKKAIFIIEESPDVRDLIQIVYAREGYETRFASNGREALEKLQSWEKIPGLILFNLTMSGTEGAQFRKEQSKDPRIASIPILLISQDSNVESKIPIVGAQGFIKKPIPLDTFLKVAAQFCS